MEPTDDILKIIKKLQQQVTALAKRQIENLTIPATGKLIVPRYLADPASPEEGQVWINTTSNTLKFYDNGTIKTVTYT